MPRRSHTPGEAAVLERYAAHLGIPVHDPPDRNYPWWNGSALMRPLSADVWAHELAHWLLATPERRQLVNYGWGYDADFAGFDPNDLEAFDYGPRPDLDGLPWPDPTAECPSTDEEVLASLLGFSFLVRVGLAAPYDEYSFLDYIFEEDGGITKVPGPTTYAERRSVQPLVAAFDQWRSSL